VSRAYKSFLGFLGLLPLALVSAAACGGNAFENRNGNGLGAAGSVGSGGSSVGSGGSSIGSGGSSVGSSAGTSHSAGGQSPGEAGAATGGAIGRGGAGSAGSATGGSGGIDVTACTSNTQCEIVHAGCCSCGNIGPAEDFTAINSAYRAQFNTRCSTVDCAGCPPMRAPQPSDPYFSLAATCQQPIDATPNTPGHCVIVDLRQTEITACKTASDCTLRSGTACCSGCSGLPTAINGSQNSALSALVCGRDPSACPACAPNFTEYTAQCVDQRCEAGFLLRQ